MNAQPSARDSLLPQIAAVKASISALRINGYDQPALDTDTALRSIDAALEPTACRWIGSGSRADIQELKNMTDDFFSQHLEQLPMPAAGAIEHRVRALDSMAGVFAAWTQLSITIDALVEEAGSA